MPELVFTLDGAPVTVPDDGASLLEVLRDRLGVTSAKDGCSPQGQCGCCTVLVDGQPRVSCVTPAARVRGREVVSVDGLDAAVRDRWADALVACGGTQCGFCTPGIVVRLAALEAKGPLDERNVGQALLAHLCRCTGWRTITDAALADGSPLGAPRSFDAASRRASIEGRAPQRVAPEIALGGGGFADDTAPRDALVAVASGDDWVIGETLSEARRNAGKVQGRRTTAGLRWPLELPAGEWDLTLRTTWVEPAYLEPDASWCEPGGEPVTRLANGGAFGGKADHDLGAVARRLADEHGRPVRVLLSREDVVRRGPKRPPIAAGLRRDGTGVVRVGACPGIADAIRSVLPAVEIEEVAFAGPPLSASLRGAGWVEAAVLRAALGEADSVTSPDGSVASAVIEPDGTVRVRVECGDPLDEVVLRSYCIGAAHMALGWVRSEGIVVDEAGVPLDLTMRSFGVLRAVDTPPIEIDVVGSAGEPVNGSDAVFAAVAAAAWRSLGHPTDWPAAR